MMDGMAESQEDQVGRLVAGCTHLSAEHQHAGNTGTVLIHMHGASLSFKFCPSSRDETDSSTAFITYTCRYCVLMLIRIIMQPHSKLALGFTEGATSGHTL